MWLILLLLSVNAIACEKGCEQYRNVCACDKSPETAVPVKPSDEKPPDDKMPSYQREGIHADMPKNLIGEDMKLDAERATADAEGKVTFGIKP